MKLEPDGRPRLDVSHAGQQQRGQQLAVARALVNPIGDLFQQLLAGRIFQQPHQRFDLWPQVNDLRIELRLGGGHRFQAGKKPQVAQTGQRAAGRRRA